MEKTICQKCGQAISNDFGITLSFCTNCGAALQNYVSEPTVAFNKNFGAEKKAKRNLLPGLMIGALSMLFLVGGIFFANKYFFSRGENSSSAAQSESSPFNILPKFNSVSASEITEISFSSWRHNGLLYSGDGFVSLKSVVFRREGSASDLVRKDYDDGKTPDEVIEKKASLTNEQFERLAASIVENDFFDQTDSTERISEGENTLTVKFSGKEKQIKTSNINKDVPEIEKILNDLKTLELNLKWSPAK